MDGDEILWRDATAQAELVRSGEVSAVDLVDASIARIEELNPALNAVIHPRFDRARAEAAAALLDRPFAGVPMVLKDLICELGGEQFHEGMAYLAAQNYEAPEDQHLARRFREAGFIIVAKSNTAELGGLPTTEPLLYGPTRNPWDRSRTPAGSSGGSAAAVASGMVAVGHANDAGGSIRGPAARCGLVGLKPSRGRVSEGPLYGDLWGGLVAELAVTRTVRDTAGVLDIAAGYEPGDPYVAPTVTRPYVDEVGRDPGPLRVAVWMGVPGDYGSLHPEAQRAVQVTADALADLGHAVSESHPPILERRRAAAVLGKTVMAGTEWAIRRWEKITGVPIERDQLEPVTRMYLDSGRATSAADLMDLIEAGQLITRDVANWYGDDYDLLLTASMAEPPQPLGVLQAEAEDAIEAAVEAFMPSLALLSWCNLTGQPAISLPMHWTDNELPMGTHLAAPYGREDLLIAIAAQLEQARPWSHRHPPV